MAVLEEIKEVNQDVEWLERENNLLQRTTEEVLDVSVREGIYSIKFVV